MGATRFFCTRTDLEPGLRRFEEARRVKYVLMGMFDGDGESFVYRSWHEIPSLGLVDSGECHANRSYLVLDASEEVCYRRIDQKSGATKFAIDQLAHPRSIEFSPGGLFGATCLMAGRVATVSSEPFSLKMAREFGKCIV